MNASGSCHSRSLLQLRFGQRRQRDDSQFRAAAAHQFVSGLGVDELDVEFDIGEALGERFQHRREPVQPDVMAGRQREATVDAPVQVAQHHFGVGQFAQQLERARLQQRAGLRQVDALADAVEQRHADAGLERLNALGDRRLGEMELFRRARKRGVVGYRDEGSKFIPFHDRSYENNEFVLSKMRSYHGGPLTEGAWPWLKPCTTRSGAITW